MPTAAILILIVFSAMLAGVLVLRPAITIHPGGKILAFGVFFFLPVFCLMAGMDSDTLPAVKANKLSCISSGCHDVVHNVRQLDKVKFWSEGN